MINSRIGAAPEIPPEVNRRGQFEQHADILAVVTMREIERAHPELRINFHIAETRVLNATTNGSQVWAMAFKEQAPSVTGVTLHNAAATADHLDEVWRILETCARP
jgi:hypothetical protein